MKLFYFSDFQPMRQKNIGGLSFRIVLYVGFDHLISSVGGGQRSVRGWAFYFFVGVCSDDRWSMDDGRWVVGRW